jgi:hypothetical protein
MRRLCALVLLSLAVPLAAACESSTPQQQPPCCDWGPRAERPGPSPDGPAADGARPKPCNCSPTEICDTQGKCITPPVPSPGEAVAELVLLKQVSPMDTTILKQLGKGEADLHDQEPLPKDNRPSWTSSEGEKCYFEIGTNYPYYYDGKSWPSGPMLGAGNLTFTVAGGAGPIVLEAMNLSGWAYFHKDTPPHLKEGATSYPDFFDAAYLPAGAAFEVKTAGGPSVGAHTLTGGELPVAFNITTPAAEAPGAQAPASGDLVVKWSPAQSSATMEIFITSAAGMDVALLSCRGRDDGSLTVPAAAMKNFAAGETLGLQLRRTTERYTKVTTTGGKVLHVQLRGRHARLGRFVWK